MQTNNVSVSGSDCRCSCSSAVRLFHILAAATTDISLKPSDATCSSYTCLLFVIIWLLSCAEYLLRWLHCNLNACTVCWASFELVPHSGTNEISAELCLSHLLGHTWHSKRSWSMTCYISAQHLAWQIRTERYSLNPVTTRDSMPFVELSSIVDVSLSYHCGLCLPFCVLLAH